MDARVASSGGETAPGDLTEDSLRAAAEPRRRPHDCIHALDHLSSGHRKRARRKRGAAPETKSDRGPEEQPVRVAALRSRAGALARDVEILDVEAQHLVGACRRLVQQPRQRALAQRDVTTFPRPLEARQRVAARLVVVFRTPVQDDVAVDVQGPQLEPLGKDCPHTRTKIDTRYPGVPCQDDYVFVASSRGETAAVCGVQSD